MLGVFDIDSMGEQYSTTRLLTIECPEIILNAGDNITPLIYLPEGKERKGEGGLRKYGYFKRDRQHKPLVTIVTAVYNGEKYLEETIQSIINQTYDNVEYIIIDGGSTDSTLDIIRKYDRMLNYWVSEKDQGISDAFNKAVRLSMGTYINFQGDGDGFNDMYSIENILRGIDQNLDMLVSGKIVRVDDQGNDLYVSKQPKIFSKLSLLFRMSLPHQGLFTNVQFFKKYGVFDANNKYCMDYELLLRAYANFPKVIFKNIIVSKWRADGLGNNQELEIFKEYDAIKRRHKICPQAVLYLINLWIILKFKAKKMFF